MMENARWLLPEGIDEVLPPDAQRVEALRRALLDMYRGWGYQLVIPPFAEYLESLLTGTGRDLDLKTFKLTDQLSGRMLGIRADMTPQVARIDAHQLRTDHPSRLCYLGTVLHTRPDGFADSRCPLQIGAELFGHAGLDADVESLRLMIETLQLVGLPDISLDLGHVGIFRGLSRQAELDSVQEAQLFDALQRKAVPEISELVAAMQLPAVQADMFLGLAELNGDDICGPARQVLAQASAEVRAAIDTVEQIAERITSHYAVPLHFDLAELRGYRFHTGTVFAAFVPGLGQEVARGGRYDNIGNDFGHSRPATGFSADLKTLIRYARPAPAEPITRIYAPAIEDTALEQAISEQRAAGAAVLRALEGQTAGPHEMGCEQQLQLVEGQWQVVPL